MLCLDELYEGMENLSIYDIISTGLVYSYQDYIGSGKMVSIPIHTDGVQIHSTSSIRKGYKEHQIPWNESLIIHARDHVVI